VLFLLRIEYYHVRNLDLCILEGLTKDGLGKDDVVFRSLHLRMCLRRIQDMDL